jgi:N-methylhydantoinase B
VIEGKVSPAAARDDYGVVLMAVGSKDAFEIDGAATAALRAKLKAARTSAPPMIDRGTGFEKMIRGEVKPWVRHG